MKFEKEPLTTREHLRLLEERGLVILEEAGFRAEIERIGYFRLSGYMYPFQMNDGSHRFKRRTTDLDILEHYYFDKRLRLILMEAIEALEVAMRAILCNKMALAYGSHWYDDPTHFVRMDAFSMLQNYVHDACKDSCEMYIQRYRSKYIAPRMPPVWMAMELMTFGKLVRMFTNLKDNPEKKAIAAFFNQPVVILESWLLSINYLRNCCAHHNRVWNRKLPLKPKLPSRERYRFLRQINEDTNRQLFGVASCMLYMLQAISQAESFRRKIHTLFFDFPSINLGYMGFHPDWMVESIWVA